VLGAICSSSDERQTAEEEKVLSVEIYRISEKEREVYRHKTST
jgi:hypothetical protein